MYYLTLSLPNVVEGGEVEIQGLGVVQNKVTTAIDSDRVNEWNLSPVGFESGKTFLQYIRSIDGAEISTTNPEFGDKKEELSSLTVAELKAKAADEGVDLGSATLKDEIVKVLAKAELENNN